MYNKSLVTIAQIHDAAKQLFVRKSYDEITMTEIARLANVTKGAIYHHLNSKEDLFLQMMDRYLNDLQERLQTAVDEDGSAKHRLTLLTKLYLTLPLQEQRVIQLVRREGNRFKGENRQQLIAAYQNTLPEQIEQIIIDGMESGELMHGNSRLLAWQYVAIVETSLSDYARQCFKTPEEMATYLTETFIYGVGN